jgi:hypothetical protein
MKLLYFALGIIALRLLDILTVILTEKHQDCGGWEFETPDVQYLWN